MKGGCSTDFFLNFANLICRDRVSRSISESPLDFEITRGDIHVYFIVNLTHRLSFDAKFRMQGGVTKFFFPTFLDVKINTQ